jgi:c-di-GMP-binding flagellar brake protein YcgR
MGFFDFLKKDKYDLSVLFSEDLITLAQMTVHLNEVCRRNTHLIAIIDERPTTFRSSFLELVGENDSVVIDILMPKYGNRFIETSSKVRIDYTFEGIMYYFETRYIETVSGRFPSIKIAFPGIIKKIQKRGSFRVSPPIDNPILVEVMEGFTEEIADISEGGISFYTHRSEREMGVGTIFEEVTFKLPTIDHPITAKAIVRLFIKGSGLTIKNKCCLEFISMKMHDKDSIAHYAIVRQREIILRMRGEG